MEFKGLITGIEIKSRATIASRDIRPLKELAKGCGNMWRGGVVIYQGKEIKKLDEPDIWAVPSWRIFA